MKCGDGGCERCRTGECEQQQRKRGRGRECRGAMKRKGGGREKQVG